MTTDNRLSDSDLTVLVERAAQGSWDSQLGPASGTMWDEVPHVTKNSYREQVLSIIFHGTKALHELGYRKPRTITTVEELDALPDGVVVISASGTIAARLQSGEGVVFGMPSSFPWVKLSLPVTVLWEPEAEVAA